jgi:hypothetical protein
MTSDFAQYDSETHLRDPYIGGEERDEVIDVPVANSQ